MKFWKSGWDRKSGFAEQVIASFPAALPPPEPLKLYFRWLEASGAVRASPEMICAMADPDSFDWSMSVEPVHPDFSIAWVGENDPALSQRMAAFFRTGGDGSYAGLWLDDDGRTQFVHQGSGSGSTLLCTLTDNPIDFLRLIAIGYDELCWPEHFDKTPREVHASHTLDDEDLSAFVPRYRLRRWVETTFGVVVPERASEIISTFSDMDQESSHDPFWNWIKAAQQRHGGA